MELCGCSRIICGSLFLPGGQILLCLGRVVQQPLGVSALFFPSVRGWGAPHPLGTTEERAPQCEWGLSPLSLQKPLPRQDDGRTAHLG